MELSTIIGFATVIVTFLLGLVSKKSTYISNHLIPVQNLLIGLIACGINYAITKDLNLTIAGLGLFTGGTYDIATNLKKLVE